MKRAVVRLPIEVVHRLDRLAEELRAAHPGEAYSRASVIRALIASGLTLAETHPAQRERLVVARAPAATTPKPAPIEPATIEPATIELAPPKPEEV